MKTKISLLLIILLLVFLTIFFWKSSFDKETTNSVNKDLEPTLTFGQITKQERINHVLWVYKQNSKYEDHRFGGENLIVTFYQWASVEQNPHRAGLLVFKIINSVPNLIWESEPIPSFITPLIKTMDLAGDGKNELLALWQNGKAESLYVYQKDGDQFKLLTPQNGSVLPVFNAPDSTIQVGDLDNDQIPEIWFSAELTEAGNLTEQYYVAYKWNGSEYFRWKERPEPFAEYKSFVEY